MSSTTGHSEAAKRYATAFLDLAESQGKMVDVRADVAALDAILKESSDFIKFIHNPLLSRQDQTKALMALSEKMGFQALTRKFLGVVATNRRLPQLSGMVSAITADIARRNGEVTAEVTSAQPLSEAQTRSIEDALSKALNAKIYLKTFVDADLMGGLIVRVGSRLIDNSVRMRLERLHRALKSPNASQDKAKMREVA